MLINRVLQFLSVTSSSMFLGATLVIAATLRFAGIAWGLPLVDGDEKGLVDFAAALNLHDLNPHLFYYGSFPYYILKAAMILWDTFRSLGGRSSTSADYYLIGRYVSAVSSTITVFLVFYLARVIAGTRVALLAAGLDAVSPLAVTLAHYAKVDAFMEMWAMLALIGMCMAAQGHVRGLYFAGVTTGLAVSTKFNAIILFIPLLIVALQLVLSRTKGSLSSRQAFFLFCLGVGGLALLFFLFLGSESLLAHVTRWTNRGFLQPAYGQIFNRILFGLAILVLGIIGSLIGVSRKWHWTMRLVQGLMDPTIFKVGFLILGVFAITSPFVFIDFQTFCQHFFFQLNKQIAGGSASLAFGSRGYEAAILDATGYEPLQYLYALRDEWGTLIFLSMIIGLVAFVKKNRVVCIAFIISLVVGLVPTVALRYLSLRTLYPLWGLFPLLGGLGIATVMSKLDSLIGKRVWQMVIAIGLITVLFWQSTESSLIQVQRQFLASNTWNMALDWLESNVPRDTKILREFDTPEIERIHREWHVHESDSLFEEALLAEWETRGYKLIMLGSWHHEFYQRHADRFQDILAEYARLKQEWTLAASFEPSAAVKGTPIYIYLDPSFQASKP